jgi:hypothetical protein
MWPKVRRKWERRRRCGLICVWREAWTVGVLVRCRLAGEWTFSREGLRSWFRWSRVWPVLCVGVSVCIHVYMYMFCVCVVFGCAWMHTSKHVYAYQVMCKHMTYILHWHARRNLNKTLAADITSRARLHTHTHTHISNNIRHKYTYLIPSGTNIHMTMSQTYPISHKRIQ